MKIGRALSVLLFAGAVSCFAQIIAFLPNDTWKTYEADNGEKFAVDMSKITRYPALTQTFMYEIGVDTAPYPVVFGCAGDTKGYYIPPDGGGWEIAPSRSVIGIIEKDVCKVALSPSKPTAEPSQPDAWKRFTSASGRFSVLFPGTPTKSSRPLVGQKNGMKATLYVFSATAEKGNAGYFVKYLDYPADYVNGYPASRSVSNPQIRLQAAERGDAVGKTLLSDGAIGLDGVPGRGYTIIFPSGSSCAVHEYLAGSRLYQLFACASKGYSTARADQFMNSFRILDEQPTNVPFVGCKADGQAGPQDAPVGQYMRITISPQLAQRVAYYKASDSFGVLAPRGWHCFETYGSSGSDLYITPMPLNSTDFSDWKGIPGYGIDLRERDGGTSGRFDVARIVARVFPAHRDFVRDVIAEGLEPASAFHDGPYPADKVTYKNKDTVEYTTPPNTEGVGTSSDLVANADPIEGVVILTNDEIQEMSANGKVISSDLGKELDLTQLSARLPPGMSDLIPVIIQRVEQEASRTASTR